MKVNLNLVGKKLQNAFPDARVEIEDYDASQWLNIKLNDRTFTVEARWSVDVVGFSEINETPDFTGHDAIYPYSSERQLSTKLLGVLREKTGRFVTRERKPLHSNTRVFESHRLAEVKKAAR